MKLIFHPEAYKEMLESARFFEAKTARLGFDLISAVEESKKFLTRGRFSYMLRPVVSPFTPYILRLLAKVA